MFARADFAHSASCASGGFDAKKIRDVAGGANFFAGPGRQSPIKARLNEISKKRGCENHVAFFCRRGVCRRGLTEVVRRGGNVQLILAGNLTVLLSQLAGRSLYAAIFESRHGDL